MTTVRGIYFGVGIPLNLTALFKPSGALDAARAMAVARHPVKGGIMESHP